MKLSRWLRFPVLAVFLLSTSFMFAQNAAPAGLDAYVNRVLKTFNVPGLSVAIVKDGKVVLAKGYGVRKLGESAAVDENTLFNIASVTKAFTAAALATLVDDGKISWDDRVYQRLPGFQMSDPYVSREMTIRDLLTHRSGLGPDAGDLLQWPLTTFTRDEIVYRVRYLKPATSFRTTFAYDNNLYVVAGQIIAAVTGKSWEEYVRERIFLPLGMNSTTLSFAAYPPRGNYAWPHSELNGKLAVNEFGLKDFPNGAAAGAINTSAAEMAKWMLVLLNHGKFLDRDGRLFSQKQSQEMWTAHTIEPIGDFFSIRRNKRANFCLYALGWNLQDYEGRLLVNHTGTSVGFVARVALMPEENLGMVVLTNAESRPAYNSILYHLLDQYLKVPPTDWTAVLKAEADEQRDQETKVRAQQEARRATDSKPLLPLGMYAGEYTDSWYGPVHIQLEAGKLVFTMDHTPVAVGDMQHWQYDTFRIYWRNPVMKDAFVTFTLTPDGRIDHFTMAEVLPDPDSGFDYQDLLFTPVAAAAASQK